LVVLGVSWGSTQALGKIATSTGHEPFGLIFWQSLIAVFVLSALCIFRRKPLVLNRRTVPFYVILATIGTVVPNVTFYMAVRELPAGIMSILISAVPMLAFPMALAMRQDRFSLVRFGGLMLGLLGVILILGPDTGGAVTPFWVMIALIGPLCYALEATYVAWAGTPGIDPMQAILGASVASLLMAAIEHRLTRLYRPYHAALAKMADRQAETVIVAVHSFTPCLRGRAPRPWQVGVLHSHLDSRLSHALIARLRGGGDLTVGDNEPYGGHLDGDAIARHALDKGRHNTLIEVRNDLIGDKAGQAEWAARLTPALQESLEQVEHQKSH
jgi:uncharacterized membrane protein